MSKEKREKTNGSDRDSIFLVSGLGSYCPPMAAGLTSKTHIMLQYILECIAFQLVFLIIYDFFLKRETFFQWNRRYLIGTYILSMVLPWVKIEAFKTSVPEQYYLYPQYLWGANDALIVGIAKSSQFSISWEAGLLYGGMLIATLFFGHKMWQLNRLRSKGEVRYFKDFTQIVIANSNVAFSFFKSIFLGDQVLQSEHENIIKHELVHIRQKHTWDLLFFELMRIVGWFNPLVYVYQSRVSELHEYIADAQVAKTNKSDHCQQLLSQVFQTQHISFINQFFKSSLIKKRIVMLQKSQSKRIWKLKYSALVPILAGMLFYTSCENENSQGKTSYDDERLISVGDVENLTKEEENIVYARLKELSELEETWQLQMEDQETTVTFTNAEGDNFITGIYNEQIRAQMSVDLKDQNKFYKNFSRSRGKDRDWKSTYRETNMMPFAVIEEVPVFPGCENDADPRGCFQKMIQRHISKNFRYPQEAQEQGIQGRVSIMFTIDEAGNIGNIRKRGPDKLLEDEAVRIISLLPKMTPGKHEGKLANVPFSIPISFKLEQSNFTITSNEISRSEGQRMDMGEVMKNLDMVPFANVDKAPVFPGCEDSQDSKACFQEKIQRHIAKNFRYPEEAQAKGIQGRVAILFTIAPDGSIGNIKYRGPDPLLESEAERIIKRLPSMQPASHEGKNVAVPFSIPITFKLR